MNDDFEEVERDDDPNGPIRTPAATTVAKNWVQEMAFEVALEYFAPEDLQLKYDLTAEQYNQVVASPPFRKAVSEYRREIDDEGIAFRLRSRKAAEDVLSEMHAMAYDVRIDAAVRVRCMENICKYAGFEAKKTDDAAGIKLQIFTNLSLNDGRDQTYTIEIPVDQGQTA